MDREVLLEAIRRGDLHGVRQGIQEDRRLAHVRAEDGTSPILLAVYHGQNEVAEFLAGDGRDLDLHEAAALGASARLQDLIASDPAIVGTYSEDGWTALHLAAFFGHATAVASLLEAGADTEALSHNRQHNTPLHAATAALRTVVARLLVQHGAEVNARNGDGLILLHLAAYAGDIGLMDLFVRNGASLEAVGDSGKTPLQMAAERGQTEAVTWLRDHEAGG